MRIAFLDFGDTEYDPASVGVIPLGGTESAACYLSRSLARQGHEVFLIGKSPAGGLREGVECIPRDRVPPLQSLKFDAVICLGTPGNSVKLKAVVGPGTRLIRWVHLAADQPPVQSLKNPAEQQAYDGIAMVSHWQREQFHQRLGVDPSRVGILRNAIGYPFMAQFAGTAPILSGKAWPPVLAYSSTPFRGLAILLEAFPRIRAAVPGTHLRVFSSLKVYGVTAEADDAKFGELYRRCRETEGVEYIGSIPQPELARQMHGVSVLSYPNTFPETSCIVAMEAMASGCVVVTSELGALPETTAGFGRLIPIRSTIGQFMDDFVAQTVQVLQDRLARPAEIEELLRRQVEYINRTATWDMRAAEWVRWLRALA